MTLTPLDLQRIGYRYQPLELIGSGGMGRVYRANDLLTGHEIALKRLQIQPNELQFNSRSTEKNLRLALAREFRTLASLRHPHIISVLNYGFDRENQPYFTMELLRDIRTITEASTGRTPAAIVQLLIQLLEALTYLHRRGIVHRDIKPGNVIVTADDRVRVLDFGLAITPEQSSDIAGTLAYMAPEVLQQRGLSQVADLYSIGVLAYELFTGRHPYPATDTAQLVMNVLNATINVDDVDVDEGIQLILMRLLEKDPLDRYQTAQDVIAALCRAIDVPQPTESIEIRESFIQAAEFVGRDEEMRVLSQALDDIGRRQPTGGAWLIAGESGVGKSRLMDELRIRALVQGATVLYGQGQEIGSLPYQLWRDAVRYLLLASDVEAEDASILKEIVPDISQILGYDVPNARKMDGIAGQRRLAGSILKLFKQQAAPIVLLLEDLQWTEESLVILDQITASVEDMRLLIVGNYRDDERPDMPQVLPNMDVMALARLERDAIEVLTVSMLGKTDYKDQVVDLLESETEGNAFFIVEVVRMLAEEAGRIEHIGRATLPEHIFSSGIQQVIERRLNRVPEAYRPMLNAAAIAGRQIDPQILAHIDPQLPLDDWLFTATEAAVIEVKNESYRFAHDKLREELLRLLLDVEKPILNRRVAEAIEEVHADNLRAYAATLARHWRAVGDTQKEGHYAIMAADDARAADLNQEALNFYLRALELEAYRHTDDPDVEEARLLNFAGGMYQRLNQNAMSRRYQLETLEKAESIGSEYWTIQALSNLGDLDLREGNYDPSRRYTERSVELARELGDQELLGLTLMVLANLNYTEFRYDESYANNKETLEIFQRLGDPILISKALNNLAIATERVHGLDAAYELYVQCLNLRREINDRFGLVSALNNAASVLIDLDGDLNIAEQYVDEAIIIAREMKNMRGLGFATGTKASLYRMREDIDAYRHWLQQAMDVARQINNRPSLARYHVDLAWTEYEYGNYLAALEHYKEAAIIRRELESEQYQLLTVGYVGRTLYELGHYAKATELLIFFINQELPDAGRETERLADSQMILAKALGKLTVEDATVLQAQAKAATLDSIITWITDEMPIEAATH